MADNITKNELIGHIMNCYNCQLLNIQSNYNALFEIIINKVFKKDINFEKDLIPIMNNNKTGILIDLKKL